MGRFIDLTGREFGRWKVIERGANGKRSDGSSQVMWLCECGCEKHTRRLVSSNSLLSSDSKSCGCVKDEKLLETGKRNAKKNKYDLSGEYGVGYASNTGEFFYFDLEDYDKLKEHCWWATHHYMWTYIKGSTKRLVMHRLILDAPDDKEVDHINWKRYDNRKENLRVCTHQENMMNCPSRQNYSGITGVVWDENRKLWTARITVEKKNKYLGRFEDKDEAIKTRLEAEAKYYGEFAPQHHLFEQYSIDVK